MAAEIESVEGPRACGRYEIGPTLDLLNQVFFPEQAGMGGWAPHLACEDNREQMRILLVNGRIVAHAGLYVSEVVTPRGTLRLGGIWGVSCHPDYRRRGFGEACVRDAMRVMQERGCDLGWLGTGFDDWYRGFGWENAGRRWEFTLDRGNIELLPRLEGYEIREGLWPDLEEMRALYAAQGLGARRPLELLPTLLRRPPVQGACFTAAHRGRLVAYLLLADGRRVIEYAGEAPIVLGLIREAFHRRDPRDQPTSSTARLGHLQVETPVLDRGLPSLLRELRLPCTCDHCGMMWIANLPSLLDKLGLAEEIAATETPQGWRLRRAEQQVELSGRHLTKLLFGPEKVADFASDLFPLEFFHWALDRV